MNHALLAPRLSLWQTAVCDDGLLRLESSRPRSPGSSQPSPVWGVRSTLGQTVRLMGVWDNTRLHEALQGRGRRPRTPSSPLPASGQEGMLNPNTAAAKQGELTSRQHHTSVPLLRAAPKLARPQLAWLSLPGTQSYILAVSERKIFFFFTPVRWCCTSPYILCDRCKNELQRSTNFEIHSRVKIISNSEMPQRNRHLRVWLLPKLQTEISHKTYSADTTPTWEKTYQLSL